MLKLTAKNVKLAVKVKSTADIFRTLDKALHYARHAVFCALPENIRIHRNLSPAEKFEVLLFCKDFKHFHRLRADIFVLRKEEHSDSVVARFLQPDSFLLCRLLEKPMRNLNKNSDSVAGLSGRIFSRAVLQLFNYAKRVVHDFVSRRTVNVYDRSDSASVMLK